MLLESIAMNMGLDFRNDVRNKKYIKFGSGNRMVTFKLWKDYPTPFLIIRFFLFLHVFPFSHLFTLKFIKIPISIHVVPKIIRVEFFELIP